MVKNENRNFSYMTRRIGGTTYKVKVVFNDTGHETMEDKILRIVRNEALDNDGKCDIMDVPQKLGCVPGRMTVEFGSKVQEFVMEVAKWQIS